MDDFEPAKCPDCHVLLRDRTDAFECPACGHRIAYDAAERPDDIDRAPGIHGG